MTAEIDTFISEVSTTRTNIAIASSTISRRLPCVAGPVSSLWCGTHLHSSRSGRGRDHPRSVPR